MIANRRSINGAVRSAAAGAILSAAVISSAGACAPPGHVTAQFSHPVNSRVYATYGPVRHPILDKVRLHAGWDYDAPMGSAVQAAAGGKVVAAAYSGNYGNLVVIDHGGGIETAYAHLRKIGVTAGACVVHGAHIGDAGSTGLSTRPHLHFEIRKNGKAADPSHWLGKPDAER